MTSEGFLKELNNDINSYKKYFLIKCYSFKMNYTIPTGPLKNLKLELKLILTN